MASPASSQILAVVEISLAATAGNTLTFVSGAVVLLPVCGWLGARNKSAACLRSFVLGNSLCAGVTGLVVILNLIISIPTASCVCDDECFQEQYQPGNREDQRSLALWQSRTALCAPGRDTVLGALWLSTGLAALGCLLQIYGACSGRQLTEAVLVEGPREPGAIPVAPVMVMPGPAQPRGAGPQGHAAGYGSYSSAGSGPQSRGHDTARVPGTAGAPYSRPQPVGAAYPAVHSSSASRAPAPGQYRNDGVAL